MSKKPSVWTFVAVAAAHLIGAALNFGPQAEGTLIDFEEADWGLVEGTELCDSGPPGNTLTDTTSGASFIIVDGSMMITTSSGDRFLFFSQVDCSDAVQPVTTLVIRFTNPQEFVKLRIYFDEHGTAPMIVNFYEEYGATSLADSRTVPWAWAIQEVIYNRPTQPVEEVMIRTDRPENILYSVEFYDSAAAIRHDVALALDGSGSMAAQNKWGMMVEAADIFHDLYRVLSDPSDGFGAVRFRWDCASILTGNQTIPQPALSALSAAADMPSIYSGDGPSSCTPVGEGVIAAAQMCAGGANPVKHILLLTDGKNNRGRSVDAASTDPLLDGLTVHTIGLGSMEHIEPAEIAALAAAHGGSFRETTEPKEILDFFAQILGEMIGKTEMVAISGDSVPIHSGTNKAVFMVAWDDPAVTHDFDLLTPGAVFVDHSGPPAIPGMTITYYPKTSGSAHAFFVAEGNVAGTWQFQSIPAGVERLAIEDLALRIKWTVTPQLGLTGQPITITAQITEKGRPYTGDARVVARVRSPGQHQGDFIAREMRKRPVLVKVAGDLSIRSQIISAVLERSKQKDITFAQRRSKQEGFLRAQLGNLVFQRVGIGIYQLTFDKTDFDGVYRFDLEARGGISKTTSPFARRLTRSVVLLANADRSSEFKWEQIGKQLFRVTFTPVTRRGVFLGPFLAEQITVESCNARLIGNLADNLDGSYSQLVVWVGDEPPNLSFKVLGKTIPLSR